ncbi:disulfide bond formation protein B [Pantoea sp. Tr-811]|uniref:disulfide bond formation protein B n=1 Tax=unclassified Pantoea TaxID=2630326 RepID=UPI00141EA684|nr:MULTISPECIES: disulfide bond formation protein B [unclassified Pantoea]NIE75398.1 disulfide bond formation protein B [Pantoea sp. Ap-967]NIF26445.1 disulfide bond formation protein B [Pantoea sp. Tr-811]
MLPARLRTFFVPACLGACAVLWASFHLEHLVGLVPCPLCFSQRALLAVYAVVCLAALLHAPGLRGLLRYARAALACAGLGALLAGRHVWLQGVAGGHVCSLPFSHVFEQPWRKAVHELLFGGPDCSSLAWSFLDLTLPEWSLLAFLLLAAMPLSALLAYRFRSLAQG